MHTLLTLNGAYTCPDACIINDVAFLLCTPDRQAAIDALNLRLLIGCHSLQMPKEGVEIRVRLLHLHALT